METTTSTTPDMALPVKKPLSVHIPKSNSHSIGSAVPVGEMPRSQQIRYERIWQNESAFLNEEKVAEPAFAQTTKSSDCDNDTKVPSEESGWASWRLGPLPNLFRRTNSSTHSSFQEDYDKIRIEEDVETFEDGIPKLAALLNIDESFGIFRAFLPETCRQLLCREIKLSLLVTKQRELDILDASNPLECRLNTVQPVGGTDGLRLELETQIYEGIKEYQELLERYVRIKALAKPTKRMHRSVHDWMIEKRPLVEGEDDWIHHVNDLVSTMTKGDYANKEGSQLDTFIEDHLVGEPGSFIHRFLTGKDKNTKTGLFLYREGHRIALRKMIYVIVAVCLLLVPVFVLFLVNMPRLAMAFTVFGFILAFAIIMSLMTEARLEALLLGTAAYGAFLATFLSNVNQCFVPTV